VVPLHKKSSRTNVGNYRPVSILSTLSKVVERLVFNQLEAYLLEQKLLYELQSGFRTAHSTHTCIIHLFDHIKQESEKGNYTGRVMLDLQKAVDTVDHDILLILLHQCSDCPQ
jgi:retron-type reverse transcriptase